MYKNMQELQDALKGLYFKQPTPEDFELIQKYVQGVEITSLYVYPVILCDNQIDRDTEKFSDKALETIVAKAPGAAGLEDHEWTTRNQHSRVYKTQLVEFEDTGYKGVLGFAYTTVENTDLINSIEAGIKKEVSIGVSNEPLICSICGKAYERVGDEEIPTCEHQKGNEYDGALCYGIIDKVSEVYEFSFVAIPAQRGAGVFKSAKKKLNNKEANVMKLKAVMQKLKGMDGITPEELAALEGAVDGTLVESLEGKVEELEKSLKAVEDEKRDNEVNSTVEGIFSDLVPVADAAKEIADSIVRSTILDENGYVIPEKVDEAKGILKANYKFLFKECGEDNADTEEKAVDGEEEEELETETVDTETEDEKVEKSKKSASSKSTQKTAKTAHGLSFTINTNVKSAEQVVKGSNSLKKGITIN